MSEFYGVNAIASERQRQVEVEGYTADKDREYAVEEFISTAIAYLGGSSAAGSNWPVKMADPESDIYQERDLVKAGALIAAAIDRLAAE